MALEKDISHSGQNTIGTLGGNVRLDESKGELVAFNGANNIGLFGFDSTGKVVVKIAKEGYDAATAPDDKLIFNSNQNVLKVVDSDTVTISAIAGQGTVSEIYHNLGFTPMVIATVKSPLMPGNNRAMCPYLSSPWLSTGSMAQIINVTESLLQFEVQLGASATGSVGDWEFRYYLLQESAV